MIATKNIDLDTYEANDETSWLTTYNENINKIDEFAGQVKANLEENNSSIQTVNSQIELINSDITTITQTNTVQTANIVELQNTVQSQGEQIVANTTKNNLQDQSIAEINNSINNINSKVNDWKLSSGKIIAIGFSYLTSTSIYYKKSGLSMHDGYNCYEFIAKGTVSDKTYNSVENCSFSIPELNFLNKGNFGTTWTIEGTSTEVEDNYDSGTAVMQLGTNGIRFELNKNLNLTNFNDNTVFLIKGTFSDAKEN